jgi:hypothetical protein
MPWILIQAGKKVRRETEIGWNQQLFKHIVWSTVGESYAVRFKSRTAVRLC